MSDKRCWIDVGMVTDVRGWGGPALAFRVRRTSWMRLLDAGNWYLSITKPDRRQPQSHDLRALHRLVKEVGCDFDSLWTSTSGLTPATMKTPSNRIHRPTNFGLAKCIEVLSRYTMVTILTERTVKDRYHPLSVRYSTLSTTRLVVDQHRLSRSRERLAGEQQPSCRLLSPGTSSIV